jgi:hypothetical protein
MEAVKKNSDKVTSFQYKCKIKSKDESGIELGKACESVVVVAKDSIMQCFVVCTRYT